MIGGASLQEGKERERQGGRMRAQLDWRVRLPR